MESEFIAMSFAGEEADWLRSMLIDIPLWGKPIPPLTIYCDNKTAIFRASSDCYNGKSRKVRLKHNHANSSCERKRLFTPSQWMELEHQALIYKYITANVPIPPYLLNPIRKALESAGFSTFTGLRPNALGWGAFHLGFSNNNDPEPGMCRRTDGVAIVQESLWKDKLAIPPLQTPVLLILPPS
ncbi:hypothetical protein CQW23_07744 [Capsicum baccatum]|uniref:Growth-regulating factor n=1 Tax=Capsicum baccatum TaxID=33114 RepID=A0A2G2X6Z1_CAPBA|nr:hypothetical protein CQW23_07744 [Capsicum baccatum]